MKLSLSWIKDFVNIPEDMDSGKPDLEMMVFSMHLFHLEIKSELQLEQHF